MAWLDLLVNCSMITVVALFLLLEGSNLPQDVSFHNGEAFYFDDHSYAHTDCSNLVPIEGEVCDENESEKDSEEEIGILDNAVLTSLSSYFRQDRLLFSQLIHATECRSGISLVILHHCWKCFLD